MRIVERDAQPDSWHRIDGARPFGEMMLYRSSASRIASLSRLLRKNQKSIRPSFGELLQSYTRIYAMSLIVKELCAVRPPANEHHLSPLINLAAETDAMAMADVLFSARTTDIDHMTTEEEHWLYALCLCDARRMLTDQGYAKLFE